MTRHHDNDNGPLGRIYTLAEAADYLRMSSKMVAKVARREGLATLANGEFLFSEKDLIAIWESMRCQTSNSLNVPEATTGTSAVRTAMAEKYSDLLKPKTKQRRRRSL